MAIHNAGAAVIAKLADLGHRRSAARLCSEQQCRSGRTRRRLFAATMKAAAKVCRYLGPPALAEIEPRGRAPPIRPASVYAMHAHGSVFAEVKSIPISQIRVSAGRPLPRRDASSILAWCAVRFLAA